MREAEMDRDDFDDTIQVLHEDCGHYHRLGDGCPEDDESCGDYRCCQP